jgi:hypothetical protein
VAVFLSEQLGLFNYLNTAWQAFLNYPPHSKTRVAHFEGDLSSGVYILEIMDKSGKRKVVKFIKE